MGQGQRYIERESNQIQQSQSDMSQDQIDWSAPGALSLSDTDFDRAPLLWSRGDARVVNAGAEGVANQNGTNCGLDWQKTRGLYDPRRCWLLDARRAWFAQPGTEGLTPLRQAWPMLDAVEAQAAVTAVALAAWHEGYGFCAKCGARTGVNDGGWVRVCANCGQMHFPRIDPAVIMALVDAQDRLLLGAQPTWGKRRSVFAGFVMAGESLEQAVRREVMEETGLHVHDIEYFGSQPWPMPRSLMVAFTAMVADPGELHVDGREIVRADWLTRDEVRRAWADGEIDPPPPMSIATRMIMSWLDGAGSN